MVTWPEQMLARSANFLEEFSLFLASIPRQQKKQFSIFLILKLLFHSSIKSIKYRIVLVQINYFDHRKFTKWKSWPWQISASPQKKPLFSPIKALTHSTVINIRGISCANSNPSLDSKVPKSMRPLPPPSSFHSFRSFGHRFIIA